MTGVLDTDAIAGYRDNGFAFPFTAMTTDEAAAYRRKLEDFEAAYGDVAGLRQGLSLALIGVVVAEYFVGNNGVGGLIVSASQVLNSDEAFVGVLIFAVAAIVLTSALRVLERRLDGWRA